MQISKKIELQLSIICVLVVINLYPLNDNVNREVVESVVESTPYGLGLGIKRLQKARLSENTCSVVDNLDLRGSKVQGRNGNALMVRREEFIYYEFTYLSDTISTFLLSNFTYLGLPYDSFNCLSGPVPISLLSNFTYLELHYKCSNRLNSVVQIYLLSKFTSIDLHYYSYNCWNGRMPASILSKLRYLRARNYDQNGEYLSGFIPKLTYVDMSRCSKSFNCSIKSMPDCFDPTMSVHLQSSKNNLSGLIPTPVALNRPRYRNLSKNNLSGLIPTYMISKRYLEYDESPYSSFQIEWEEFAEIYPLSLGYLSGVNVYDDSRRVMLIPKEKEEASIWTFMKPFTPGMWCTIAGVMIYTALVVWLLEQKLNPLLYREMSTMEVFTLIWSAVSTMSLSQNVRIQSNLARVVIAIWLLVMSIIVTTYSSNFTSRLNAQETPKSLGVKDFLGWFIITVSVSTLVVIVFLFNLIYSSGTDPNVIGQETDPASPDPLEMLPPNDDPEEQSSVERATLQTMRISNISNSQENALVEPSSVYIPHIADEPGSMEDQNI